MKPAMIYVLIAIFSATIGYICALLQYGRLVASLYARTDSMMDEVERLHERLRHIVQAHRIQSQTSNNTSRNGSQRQRHAGL